MNISSIDVAAVRSICCRLLSVAVSFAVWCALISAHSVAVAGDGDCWLLSPLKGSCFDPSDCEEEKKEDEPKCNFGPCPCQERKTLMQWSYGTSFSGGPPSMDEPLEADRPDFTESPLTVGKGVVQLEAGYTFTTDSALGVRSNQQSFPQTLWRIGMFAEWFEWRLQYNYETSDITLPGPPGPGNHIRLRGSDDMIVGFKITLTPQEGILPKMGIIPQLSVPTGSPAFTADEVLPSFNWSYAWDINEKLHYGMSTLLQRARDDVGNVYTEFAQSGSLEYDITKKLDEYTELYMISPTGHTIDQVQYYFDGGITYHVTNNLQLDAEAGVGLNAAASDFFAGAGIVVRY